MMSLDEPLLRNSFFLLIIRLLNIPDKKKSMKIIELTYFECDTDFR